MKLSELINQLEMLFLTTESTTTKEKESPHTEENDTDQMHTSVKDRIKKALSLLFTFLVDLIKMPFLWFFNYFKEEVVTAIKKDIRTMLGMAAIMSILYLFLLILWFSVSVFVGVLFYEKGFSIISSIFFSIVFQLIIIILLSIVLYSLSKKQHTRKMLKKLANHREQLNTKD
ncbi:MAG: hypothetical protein ACP5F6_03390 [Microbacter sp.]